MYNFLYLPLKLAFSLDFQKASSHKVSYFLSTWTLSNSNSIPKDPFDAISTLEDVRPAAPCLVRHTGVAFISSKHASIIIFSEWIAHLHGGFFILRTFIKFRRGHWCSMYTISPSFRTNINYDLPIPLA